MAKDVNAMSDEELLDHMDNLPIEEEVQEDLEESTEEVEETEEDVTEDIEDTYEEESDEEVVDTDEDTQETDETEDEDDEEESQSEDDDEDEEAETEEEETEDTQEEAQDTDEIDYKAFYEEVTSEYKANGKMMPGFKDPQQFKRALSMAANYAQKTTAIKPHLGRVKMLKDITDDQLNEMLDFHNGNQDVIKKALKEHKMDPMDINIDEEVQYQANDYSVSQAEIEWEETVNELRATPEFPKIQESISNDWDEESKNELLTRPDLLIGLQQEIELGRYDDIQTIIKQERMLGNGKGMSDLAMYSAIAESMGNTQPQQTEQVVVPKENPQPNPEVKQAVKKEKQKAAIKTRKRNKVEKKYDPTQMSDEDFMKLIEDGKQFQ